ncbi:MAG TPA: glycosyltransferase family 2 protein [Candidatus Omnitrophota bacterium]|nr:glycosyltransferase family 2 protein [Candidatus Omnitrophota bacterium]
MESKPFITFITPIYNEEQNIARMLANLFAVLNQHPEWNWEVILIEDGSRDNTLAGLRNEVVKYPHTRLIIHEKNMGYNASLRDGLRASRGQYMMYIGADEEFDSSEIPQFVEILRKGEADVLLGVRWQRNAYQLFRFFLSVIYIFFLNWLYKVRINDYNWSQAWNRKVFEKIELTSHSLFVLPEIIVKAIDLGFKIKEIPSNHRGRQWGKSSLNMRIMGAALWDSIQFGWLRKTSKYRPESSHPFLSRSQSIEVHR